MIEYCCARHDIAARGMALFLPLKGGGQVGVRGIAACANAVETRRLPRAASVTSERPAIPTLPSPFQGEGYAVHASLRPLISVGG